MISLTKTSIDFYSIAAGIGLAAAFVVCFFLAKKRSVPILQLVYIFLYAVIGVFAGGHIMFFIISLPDWIPTLSGRVNSLGDLLVEIGYAASGMVFYGGLLGALLMIFIFCRTRHLDLRPELNNTVVVFPLFHFFGRIGCTLTGCCYGIEYHGPGAIHYSAEYTVPGKSDMIANFPHFPVQPLEAVLELALFAALLIIYIKSGDRFSLTCIYLLAYAVIRFADEFLRGDDIRGIWGPFSTSQWISLFIIIAVIIYIVVKNKKQQSKYAS